MSAGGGNPSPTASENAQQICAQLESYAKPRGGLVKIVENERHLWEEVVNNGVVSEAPRIFILWTGEIARGEYAGGDRTNLHRVDRQWMVVVMRGHGFKNLSAESVGQPGTPGYYESFSDSLETVRDGIRVMSGISEEFPIDYRSIRPLPNIGPSQAANVFLDCRMIEFATAADIPAIGEGMTL